MVVHSPAIGSPVAATRRLFLVGVTALSLVSLAACSGPGGSSASSTTSAAAVAASGATGAPAGATGAAVAAKAATLTVFTGAGTQGYTQALADAFHTAYPKITVKLQVEADNNYNTVLPRLLASSSPPDVSQPADLIVAVKDSLIANLDSYATQYGWAKKVPSTVLDAGRVTGGVIGTGSLYVAGGAAGPLVGFFYNRDLATKVGMTTVPDSIATLETLFAKAKSMGITPIVASNQDGLIGHLYSLLLADYMGPQALLDITWHKPGATLNTPQAKAATAKLLQWMKAGYFNTDANAINQDASYGEFAGGKGLFMVQGTWITQALPKAFAGKYGIFAMPPVTAGGKHVSMTGNQLAAAISAHSKQKDLAALYLNFLTTPAAAAVASTNGYPGVSNTSAAAPSLTAVSTAQIQDGYSQVATDNGFTNWLQNSATAMSPAETAQLQELLAGKTSSDAAVTTLQTTYANAIKG